uniref:TraB domain-containing protein n=1 Tax=Trichuris muris TaxID=70415 RepID=A0A5S6R5L2_TRIMR
MSTVDELSSPEEQADQDDDATVAEEEFVSTITFTRNEDESDALPPTVTAVDCSCTSNDDDIGSAVHIGRIYLIGTAHFSLESQEDVRKVMRKVQPNAVMVELCPSRAMMLELDNNNLLAEASQMSFFSLLRSMKTKHGITHGFLQAALLSLSAHFTRELGMTPGGEFRVALEESKKIKDCTFHLGDRPVNITLRRAVANLGLWHRFKFLINMISTLNTKITEKEIERLKESDMLEDLLREISGQFPSLAKVLLEERDQYMASVLRYLAFEEFHRALSSKTMPRPFNIVGVVGMGHVPGIVKNFNQDINIKELTRIPARRRHPILRFTVTCVAVGLCTYGAYRLAKSLRSLFF